MCIGDDVSAPVSLDFSVPQGSVLGPQWFTIYTYPIRYIVMKYNLAYHVYADDTQIIYPSNLCSNIVFQPSNA